MKKLSCLVAYLFAKPLYVYVYSQPKHINQNVCKTRQSWNYYIWQSKEIYWQLLKRIWHDNTSFFSDKEQGHCSVPWLSTSATSFCKNTEYFSSNTMGKDISQLSHYLNLFIIFNSVVWQILTILAQKVGCWGQLIIVLNEVGKIKSSNSCSFFSGAYSKPPRSLVIVF